MELVHHGLLGDFSQRRDGGGNHRQDAGDALHAALDRRTVGQIQERLTAAGSRRLHELGRGRQSGPTCDRASQEDSQELRDAGAPIILGTDSPQSFSVPDFSIHREMQVMAAAGLTPFEILQSGARNVALCFNTLKETGRWNQASEQILFCST